jgi:membrane protein implicated in regulation of membrane protease activity
MLDLVYAAIVIISFLFAFLSLIGAGLDQIFDFEIGSDGEGPFDLVGISPFSAAVFGSAFGLTGLITHLWLDMEAIPSILWATGVGIVFGGAAQVLFLYVLSPSKSSHFSHEKDSVGREAEVTVAIPSKGLGQISYTNVSGRVRLGARSESGEEIETGELVVIKRIVGRVAVVELSE